MAVKIKPGTNFVLPVIIEDNNFTSSAGAAHLNITDLYFTNELPT